MLSGLHLAGVGADRQCDLLILQDKMDGFVPTHFFGWWLKVWSRYGII